MISDYEGESSHDYGDLERVICATMDDMENIRAMIKALDRLHSETTGSGDYLNDTESFGASLLSDHIAKTAARARNTLAGVLALIK